jgi:hypothetical protein
MIPTCVDDIIKIVKFANLTNKKITVLSGGHSTYMMRDFPEIKCAEDNLIVLDLSMLKRISRIGENRVLLEAGVIVKDIKQFNNRIVDYFCIHGDCDTVGMGFWIHSLSGISGISCCSTQFGFGCDYIRTINYVTTNGEYKTLTDKNCKEFQSLIMIGGEFGIITSIEVEMIHMSKPKQAIITLLLNGMGVCDFIKKTLSTRYDGNITICLDPSCKKNDVIYVRFTYFSDVVDYPKTVFENCFELKYNKLCKIIDIQNSNYMTGEYFTGRVYETVFNNKFRHYDIGCRICENTYKYIDEFADIINKSNSTWFTIGLIFIGNPKCEVEIFNEYPLYVEFIESSDMKTDMNSLLNKYCHDNIKCLNVPTYGVELKDYITRFSKMSLDELVEMKNIMDPNKLLITRYNLNSI